jgi:predicted ester cyclase
MLGRGKKQTPEELKQEWAKEEGTTREERRKLVLFHMNRFFAHEDDESVGKRYIDYGPTKAFWEKFPNLAFKLEEQIVGDERVVTRWRAVATTPEGLPGGPPPGTEVMFSGVTVTVVSEDDDVIERDWTYFDASDLLKKMGVLPDL